MVDTSLFPRLTTDLTVWVCTLAELGMARDCALDPAQPSMPGPAKIDILRKKPASGGKVSRWRSPATPELLDYLQALQLDPES